MIIHCVVVVVVVVVKKLEADIDAESTRSDVV
jgi:hypothetical protein